MMSIDDELAEEYLAECCDHLAAVESDLLAIEMVEAEFDKERVSRIFRAIHAIKGQAGFFELVKIQELAHQTEEVLALIRSGSLTYTLDAVRVLLHATDRLHDLVENAPMSNQADIGETMAALARLQLNQEAAKGKSGESAPTKPDRQNGRHLRILLAEDDFVCRLVMQTFLSRYGECHVAVNGREAVELVRFSAESSHRYDLICMDIMMPELDGGEAVRQVRAFEESRGILSSSGARIIMTTAVGDIKEVSRCYKHLCDAYLVKPVDLAQLLDHMRAFELV